MPVRCLHEQRLRDRAYLPAKSDPAAEEEFGPLSEPAVVQRLGNLVLAEKSINASPGNRPYSEKRPIYQQSRLLLTRAPSKRPKVGANTRIDRAVARIEPYAVRNEAAIQDRQKALVTLSRAAWGIPGRQSSPTSQDWPQPCSSVAWRQSALCGVCAPCPACEQAGQRALSGVRDAKQAPAGQGHNGRYRNRGQRV